MMDFYLDCLPCGPRYPMSDYYSHPADHETRSWEQTSPDSWELVDEEPVNVSAEALLIDAERLIYEAMLWRLPLACTHPSKCPSCDWMKRANAFFTAVHTY